MHCDPKGRGPGLPGWGPPSLPPRSFLAGPVLWICGRSSGHVSLGLCAGAWWRLVSSGGGTDGMRWDSWVSLQQVGLFQVCASTSMMFFCFPNHLVPKVIRLCRGGTGWPLQFARLKRHLKTEKTSHRKQTESHRRG